MECSWDHDDYKLLDAVKKQDIYDKLIYHQLLKILLFPEFGSFHKSAAGVSNFHISGRRMFGEARKFFNFEYILLDIKLIIVPIYKNGNKTDCSSYQEIYHSHHLHTTF
jgi:hypothetical protein